MKHFYDKGVSEAPLFEKGDLVWLDTKNIHQKRPTCKFSDKCLGPFKVLENVGELDYKLDLLSSWKIHPVFHIMLLTKHTTSTMVQRPTPARPPPAVEADTGSEYIVAAVLDSRIFQK